MNYALLATLTYATFVLQSTLAPDLAVSGIVPQFVPLVLLLTALQLRGRAGLLLAAGWGLLSDCLGPDTFGPDVVCFSLAVYLLQQIRRHALLHSPVGKGCMLALLISFTSSGSAMLHDWRAHQAIDYVATFRQSAYTAGYSGTIGLALLLVSQALSSLIPQLRQAPAADVANRWNMLTE